jgi:hypothetical protein
MANRADGLTPADDADGMTVGDDVTGPLTQCR